jgi:hypothetical protein
MPGKKSVSFLSSSVDGGWRTAGRRLWGLPQLRVPRKYQMEICSGQNLPVFFGFPLLSASPRECGCGLAMLISCFARDDLVKLTHANQANLVRISLLCVVHLPIPGHVCAPITQVPLCRVLELV